MIKCSGDEEDSSCDSPNYNTIGNGYNFVKILLKSRPLAPPLPKAKVKAGLLAARTIGGGQAGAWPALM